MIIIYSIIAILATASFSKLLHFSIQQDQILGGWQNVLSAMDRRGSLWVKPLGYCEICFAHLLGQISSVLFMAILCFINPIGLYFILLYVCYVPICSIVNLYFITKLFQ